jgi:hypothetical protein
MHVHKYIYAELGGERVIHENGKKKFIKVPGFPIFRCILPDCNHYVSRNNALGMKTICWRCGEEMIMKVYHLKETKPHHRECRKGEKNA